MGAEYVGEQTRYQHAKRVISMEQRIEQLETRVAFQDETLNRLSDIIASQRKELDQLQQEMAELKDRFRELRLSGVTPQEPETPPHY